MKIKKFLHLLLLLALVQFSQPCGTFNLPCRVRGVVRHVGSVSHNINHFIRSVTGVPNAIGQMIHGVRRVYYGVKQIPAKLREIVNKMRRMSFKQLMATVLKGITQIPGLLLKVPGLAFKAMSLAFDLIGKFMKPKSVAKADFLARSKCRVLKCAARAMGPTLHILNVRVPTGVPLAVFDAFCPLFDIIIPKTVVNGICGAEKEIKLKKVRLLDDVHTSAKNLTDHFWNTGDLEGHLEQQQLLQFNRTLLPAGKCGKPYATEYPKGHFVKKLAFNLPYLKMLPDGPTGRTDGNLYSRHLVMTNKIKFGRRATEPILDKDTFTAGSAGATLAIEMILAGLVAALELPLGNWDAHDGLIDSAEIQATYQNTKIVAQDMCDLEKELDKIKAKMGKRMLLEDETSALQEKLHELKMEMRNEDMNDEDHFSSLGSRFSQMDEEIEDLTGRLNEMEGSLNLVVEQLTTMVTNLQNAPAKRKVSV